MKIEYLLIKNYRGLDIEIDNIENICTLIGQNDSGKSNICEAVLKVLNFEKRKKPFVESDSTMGNKEPIQIQIRLSLDDLTNDQYAIVREYIHKNDNGEKYMVVRLESIYNTEILEYEDNLFMGDPAIDEIQLHAYHQNPLDKILSVVYINPSYNKDAELKHFFAFKEEYNKGQQKVFSTAIEEKLSELKDNIQREENIVEMQNDINNQGDFQDLLEGVNFEIIPNIRLNNIYKSLGIITLNENGNEINNIGDGKNKIFSMLLKSKTCDKEKKKIYLVEEPENHLYVLLQRFYIEAILSLKPSQLIITTHSPYIVDFEKTKQIIKLNYDYKENSREILSAKIDNERFKEFGYLINVEVAEMLYYNNVLLVEGDSEKYFYNMLMIKDYEFHKFILKNKFGIFDVNGIAFETIKNLLNSLGVNVIIKTDNDIFKVQNTENTYRYAGLERCIKYINQESKDELKKILKWKNLEKENFRFEGNEEKIDSIEENIEKISQILFNNGILFSTHNDGFEKDFLDYINYSQELYQEAFDFLKQAKLKNLHEFICENNIDIKINQTNKKSILVRFVNE